MFKNMEELKKYIREKISILGINQEFKENPAYSLDLLSKINSFLSVEDLSSIRVSLDEENKSISIKWTSKEGDNHSIVILVSMPDKLECISVVKKKPYSGLKVQTIKEKIVEEMVATLNKDGSVTIVENLSLSDNLDRETGEYNNETTATRYRYDSYGINIESETKHFSTQVIDGNKTSDLLIIPRAAFNINGISYENYDRKILLKRNQIDTTRILFEDKLANQEFSSTVPLDRENGLRNMKLNSPFVDSYVNIQPLSKEEIDEMILAEGKNEVIAEGLMRCAGATEDKDEKPTYKRVDYSYDSTKDPSYVYKGFNTPKAR